MSRRLPVSHSFMMKTAIGNVNFFSRPVFGQSGSEHFEQLSGFDAAPGR
jgi:hypothetical protein